MKKQTNDNYLLHQVCSNPHLVEQCSMWLKKDDKMAGDIQTKKKMTGSNIMSHLNDHHTSQPNNNKVNNQSTAAQISLHILLVTETWQPDINGGVSQLVSNHVGASRHGAQGQFDSSSTTKYARPAQCPAKRK